MIFRVYFIAHMSGILGNMPGAANPEVDMTDVEGFIIDDFKMIIGDQPVFRLYLNDSFKIEAYRARLHLKRDMGQ